MNSRSDSALLRDFLSERDEQAFEALVDRHGPMVFHVARRILHSDADSEDVVQAVFLTLATKASTLKKSDSLPGWLYHITFRAALNEKKRAGRQRAREEEAERMKKQIRDEDQQQSDLLEVAYSELDALPEKHRTPLVLHHLEGHSHAEAAHLLGINKSAFTVRLSRARQFLKKKIERRSGSGMAGALLFFADNQMASLSAVSPQFSHAIAAKALTAASGAGLAGGVASTNVIQLMKGVESMLLWAKVKSVAAILAVTVAVGASGGGVYVATTTAAADNPPVVDNEPIEADAEDPTDTIIRNKKLQAAGSAPHVLKTTPEAFANDVDPALDKITVTFDRPMMDGSWSFTAGDKAFSEKTGSTFPERVGEISYDAALTTCTMPVKLEPGTVYWVGVNSPQHQSFRSADGTPARPYQILFATRSADGKPTPLPEELVKQAKEINAAALSVTQPRAEDVLGLPATAANTDWFQGALQRADLFLGALRQNMPAEAYRHTTPEYREAHKGRLEQVPERIDLSKAKPTQVYVAMEAACVVVSPVMPKGRDTFGALGLKMIRVGKNYVIRDIDWLPNDQALRQFVDGFRKAYPAAQDSTTRQIKGTLLLQPAGNNSWAVRGDGYLGHIPATAVDVFQRLQHACDINLGPHHVVANITTIQRFARNTQQIKERLEKYRRQLDSRISSGHYPDAWGSPMGEDRDQFIKRKRESALANHLEYLQDRYANEVNNVTIESVSNSPELVTKTVTYNYRVRDGERRNRGRIEKRVINNTFSAIYLPRSSYGTVDHGIAEDPGLARRGIQYASTPMLLGWSATDMKSIQPIATPEGDGLRIAFARGGTDGPEIVQVLEVLPAMDYRVRRSIRVHDGHVLSMYQFDDFRRLETGSYYPHKQTYAVFRNGTRDGIREAILSENWEYLTGLAPEDIEADQLKQELVEVSSIEQIAPLQENEFDLVFDAGSLVVDTRHKHDVRMVLDRPLSASAIAEVSDGHTLPSGASLENRGRPHTSVIRGHHTGF